LRYFWGYHHYLQDELIFDSDVVIEKLLVVESISTTAGWKRSSEKGFRALHVLLPGATV
jgi:hypothetical protein